MGQAQYQHEIADNFQQVNFQSGINKLSLGGHDMEGSRSLNAEATRLWARFFNSGNSANLMITIAANWANFITVQLLSNSSFEWMRQLLTSGLASNLGGTSDLGHIDFSIPPTCPDFHLQCLAEDGTNAPDVTGDTGLIVPPKKRSHTRSARLVESEVRRSPRLKSLNKGFIPDGCKEKIVLCAV